jgi:hypothetical protein
MSPTQITKELDNLARKLSRTLLAFYYKYIKGKIVDAKRLYENRIKLELRKTIESSYLKGLNDLDKTIRVQVPGFAIFISSNDLENIQATTNKMSDSFWTTAEKLHLREVSYRKDLVTGEFEQRNPFDIEAAMTGSSLLLAYAAYNLATTEKIKEIQNPTVFINIGFGVTNISDIDNKKFYVVYRRRNPPEVDPIVCEPYRNKIFEAGDPSMPPLPQHKHCRCLYVPIIR